MPIILFLLITTAENSITYSATLSQAALSALRLLVLTRKKGAKQLDFIHVSADRSAENIFILLARLVNASFGGPLVSEDRAVAERHQMTA